MLHWLRVPFRTLSRPCRRNPVMPGANNDNRPAHTFTGQFKSGRRWVREPPPAGSPPVPPGGSPAAPPGGVRFEPEWDSVRQPGRIFREATCATVGSDIERDTVSRALGGLFRGMAKAAAARAPVTPAGAEGSPVPGAGDASAALGMTQARVAATAAASPLTMPETALSTCREGAPEGRVSPPLPLGERAALRSPRRGSNGKGRVRGDRGGAGRPRRRARRRGPAERD